MWDLHRTTGRLSRRFPLRWSHRHPARSTSTSQPLPHLQTKAQTRRLGRADGRRPIRRTLFRRTLWHRRPAPTCHLLLRPRLPFTQTPTNPRASCRCRPLPPPSARLWPSKLPTVRRGRSSSVGMRRRKLGWRRRGGRYRLVFSSDAFDSPNISVSEQK